MSVNATKGDEFFGVLQGRQLGPHLKKQALLFDRLAVLHLQTQIDIMNSDFWWYYRHVTPPVTDLEWLRKAGIIFEPTFSDSSRERLHADPLYQQCSQGYWAMKEVLERSSNELPSGERVGGFAPLPKGADRQVDDMIRASLLAQNFQVRCASMRLQVSQDCESVPVYSDIDPLITFGDGNDSVVHVVLSSLPLPDDQTDWEEIREFRACPDNVRALRALRRWMRNLATRPSSEKEMKRDLEFLIEEYRDHMALQRMKIASSALETVVTITAEIAENLVKLKLGSIAKLLFTTKHRQIALLEAERDAPGKEVAYIIKAKEAFE